MALPKSFCFWLRGRGFFFFKPPTSGGFSCLHLEILLLKNLVERQLPCPPNCVCTSSRKRSSQWPYVGVLMCKPGPTQGYAGYVQSSAATFQWKYCPSGICQKVNEGTGVLCWPGRRAGFSSHPGGDHPLRVSFWNHLWKPPLVGE